MNETANRKYILVLAGLALLLLVGGALFRPKKLTPEPPSPSEMASLQSRVRREHLAETAEYFAERAQAVSAYVRYNTGRASSSVAWREDGQMLTTRTAGHESAPPLSLVPSTESRPPAAPLGEAIAGQWTLAVARAPEGQLLWTPAVFGGAKQSVCAGEPFRELIVNTRLGPAMSGAGVFDLDGALLGVVANCGNSDDYRLVSNESVPSLLGAFARAAKRLEATCGLRIEALTPDSKRALAIEQGMLVTEVADDGPADQAWP